MNAKRLVRTEDLAFWKKGSKSILKTQRRNTKRVRIAGRMSKRPRGFCNKRFPDFRISIFFII